MGVGIQMKNILRDKKMTIKQLSERSGISVNTLYSISKRDSERVDRIILQRIADTLDVHILDLVGIGKELDTYEDHLPSWPDNVPIPAEITEILNANVRDLYDALPDTKKDTFFEEFIFPQINKLPSPEVHAKNKKNSPYSSEAMRLAQDYDRLDEHGKRIVRLVTDEEMSRCMAPAPVEQLEPETVYFIVPWFFHPMSAGTGEEAGSEQPDDLRLTKAPPRGTSYVAPVSGDSMEPTYHDGDKLFIRSQEEVAVGQIGVFLMDGQQWVKERGDGVLISHNQKYDPIPMREDIKCQGLVLGVCDENYFK